MINKKITLFISGALITGILFVSCGKSTLNIKKLDYQYDNNYTYGNNDNYGYNNYDNNYTYGYNDNYGYNNYTYGNNDNYDYNNYDDNYTYGNNDNYDDNSYDDDYDDNEYKGPFNNIDYILNDPVEDIPELEIIGIWKTYEICEEYQAFSEMYDEVPVNTAFTIVLNGNGKGYLYRNGSCDFEFEWVTRREVGTCVERIVLKNVNGMENITLQMYENDIIYYTGEVLYKLQKTDSSNESNYTSCNYKNNTKQITEEDIIGKWQNHDKKYNSQRSELDLTQFEFTEDILYVNLPDGEKREFEWYVEDNLIKVPDASSYFYFKDNDIVLNYDGCSLKNAKTYMKINKLGKKDFKNTEKKEGKRTT